MRGSTTARPSHHSHNPQPGPSRQLRQVHVRNGEPPRDLSRATPGRPSEHAKFRLVTGPHSAQRIRVQRLVRASLLRRSTCSVGLPGLVAQGESVRLTRGRSLVRSQSGPQHKVAVKRLFLDFEPILWSPPSGPIRPNLSALVDLQVVQRVQSRSRIVEFVAVEICMMCAVTVVDAWPIVFCSSRRSCTRSVGALSSRRAGS